MKKVLLAMSSAVLFLCGCQIVNEAEVVEEKTFDPVAVERALGDKLVKAYQENDAKTFVAAFPPEMKERFGQKEFEMRRKYFQETMGEIEKFEYLTTLEAPGFRSYIWKVTFKRTKVRDKSVELHQETLFRLMMTTPPKEGAKPYLMAFGFL